MPKGPVKVTIACPHCGSTQAEPEQARSTFCRKCGRHIDLLALRGPAPAPAARQDPGFIDRLSRIFHREKVRDVVCLHCHAQQQVSSLAKSGTCTGCGHYLDFRDIKIDGPFSKTIETHGTITVTRSGELASPRAACAAALIQGKLNGNLICSTTAVVRSRGRILGSIQARHLVIDRKADVEFIRPLHATTAEINGKISARIFADSVLINKTGALDGAVTAKAIKIERGGIFHGDLVIGQKQEQQAELPLPDTARRKSHRPDPPPGGQGPMLLNPA